MNRVRNKIAGGIIAVGIISGIILNFLFPFSSILLGGPVIGIFLLLVALVILLLCGVVTFLRRKSIGPRTRSIGLIWCACALSLFLFTAIGDPTCFWEFDFDRAYVAKAVPVLNAIKAKTGSYPDKLPTSEFGEPPDELHYFGDKDHFEFRYFGFDGDLYLFPSSTGVWEHWS